MSKRHKRHGKKGQSASEPSALDKREIGEPGGGAGRRDDVGRGGGVYPFSAADRPHGDIEIRTQREWGQKGLPPDAPEPAGGSELVWRDGVLLGGLTAGPNGEPTIDIHQRVRNPPDPTHQIGNPAGKHHDDDRS